MRAMAATMISWHHFTFYPPLADQAMPIAGEAIIWVRDHARAAQVFFVVSGYILARRMSHRTWGSGPVGRFVIHRYCRLGLPYLAAIGLAAQRASDAAERPLHAGLPATAQGVSSPL
jgi:peptidoglycan/LPS O-acetylase OafA/YrhL